VLFRSRSPGERRKLSNEWPENAPFELLALDLGSELSAVQPDKWSRKLADPKFDAPRAHEALAENYRRMPASYAGDLRALFDHLVRPDARAVLVHCAAGKDRTGFVSAMLLTALGVPHETILTDYLATNGRYSFDRLVSTRLRLVLHVDKLPEHADPALRVLASVQPEFLAAAFEVLQKQYGGAQGYLENHCGLTPERRGQLHAALLET
jgi:protein-tyrosine phosphatase